ncbi:thiol:disulfide interchange protein DsbA/DsbL [Luteibacter pinisoli]|uniref:Thiol:disulfide interchange protein DsbA/DsbL n=1 Tax=Luteibacter pinisoli TaxID=2589080 RepID=A0A4Y5Z9A7_9GAMM|nr:thiol:disulfide interchange protein DsbA/DsbL [Luteibacter pinisoli]QDE41109.1 thiol:disulfide interchange protein DsbA/DsbL [Luteibacter pinisoli]
MIKRLSFLFLGLAMATACSAGGNGNGAPAAAAAPAASFTEGKEYVATDTPGRYASNGKVEVIEVFSYGCIHCAHYEEYAEKLQQELPKGVTFRAVPAAFNDAWLPYAQAFYAAQKLNVLAKTHAALFKAIHTDHYPLRTIEELADWYHTTAGVDTAKFLAIAKSPEVRDQILADVKRFQGWGIDGTPTLVVDGKYRSKQIESFDQLNDVTKFLVNREIQGVK